MLREPKWRTPYAVVLLRDTSGQSWVETVVMLPVIVALLLGLFYLHDLPASRMRAIQAARFVAWESTWYVRDRPDNPNRAMKTPQQLQARLKQVGLGFGLKKVEVLKRDIRKYEKDQIGGVDPELFVPCAVSNLFGGACGTVGKDQSKGFIEGLASGLSGVVSALDKVFGPLAFGMHDLMAENLNWTDELNDSVYTSVVRYRVGYTGFFASLGTSNIVQTASVLSHPYTLRRTDNTKEYEELLGDACDFSGKKGHVVGLWLLPKNPIPIFGSGGTSGAKASEAISALTTGAKCVASAFGKLGKMLDSGLGTDIGFTMPDGTLKEYPELSMPTKTGVSSGNGSGGSFGKKCGEGGGGGMGVGGGCP